MNCSDLIAQATAWGCQALPDEPMSRHTSLQVGGPAEVYITVPDGETAARLLTVCRQATIPFVLVGNGSNLLVSDDGIRGAVIRLDGENCTPSLEGNGVIRCPAGVSMKQVSQFARDNGLTGLEFAFGIPGTVGGGLVMNAGAYSGQMADVAYRVESIAPDGTVRYLSHADMELDYRHSVYQKNGDAVTCVWFALKAGDPETIGAYMNELMRRRREKQPLEYPSAGSFFKRPVGQYAGELIERCGLKGLTVGGAQVSEKHANFIINRDHATAADIYRLYCEVQRRVEEQTGFRLETEVQMIGRFED